MIEVKCNRGEMSLHMNGDVSELCADLMCIIHSVYFAISEEDMIEGLMLRAVIEEHIKDVMSLDNEDFAEFEKRRNNKDENSEN